jgi:hypothetical protein
VQVVFGLVTPMSIRLKKTLNRWKQSSMAWSDDDIKPGDNEFIRSFLAQPEFAKSGRMMWNLGMWLDSAWQHMDKEMQSFVLSQVAQIMLDAKHNRAYGLWKLGETLGQHIGTTEARLILLQVLTTAASVKAQYSALHGLVHYAADHPQARRAIIAKLNPPPTMKRQPGLRKEYKKAVQAIQQREGCVILANNKW